MDDYKKFKNSVDSRLDFHRGRIDALQNLINDNTNDLNNLQELSIKMNSNLSKIATLNLSFQNQVNEQQLIINDLEKRISYLEVKVS